MNIHSSSPRKVKSACPYCGVGCGIVLDVTGNRITKVSGDKDHPANAGRLCTKGVTSADMLAAPGRLAPRWFVRDERGTPSRAPAWTRRSRRPPAGCGRSSTSTARTRSRCTSPGR